MQMDIIKTYTRGSSSTVDTNPPTSYYAFLGKRSSPKPILENLSSKLTLHASTRYARSASLSKEKFRHSKFAWCTETGVCLSLQRGGGLFFLSHLFSFLSLFFIFGFILRKGR